MSVGVERRAGQRERAALGAAFGAHARFVHIVHGHHNARELRGIEEHAAEIQLFGIRIRKAANDVAVLRRPFDGDGVFRIAALAASIERGHHKSRAGIGELAGKTAAIARIAVEFQHGGTLALVIRGLHQLGVYARAAHAREI